MVRNVVWSVLSDSVCVNVVGSVLSGSGSVCVNVVGSILSGSECVFDVGLND